MGDFPGVDERYPGIVVPGAGAEFDLCHYR